MQFKSVTPPTFNDCAFPEIKRFHQRMPVLFGSNYVGSYEKWHFSNETDHPGPTYI